MNQNKLKSEELDSEIKQTQKAGNNSNQIQIGTFVNQGISEERVRSIFNEMIPEVVNEYTEESLEIANYRIHKLEKMLMPKILENEDAIKALRDPAFQRLLKKAQQTAAVTNREDDYSMLSELLERHIQEGEDRKKRTAILKSVEIIDLIDIDALCALTIVFAICNCSVKYVNVNTELDRFNDIFSNLLFTKLPIGEDWMDHLDSLGAIRIEKTTKFNKMSNIYFDLFSGYICIGIEKNTENYKKAIDLLEKNHMSKSVLVENEFLEGYVKLQVANKKQIKVLEYIDSNGKRKLYDYEIEVLEKIWDLYSKDYNLQKSVENRFMELWNSYDSLKTICKWWDEIPVHFEITLVGKMLSYVNFKRLYPSVPDLINRV